MGDPVIHDTVIARDDAERLGGRTIVAPWKLPDPGPSFAIVADPEGNPLGLVHRMRPGETFDGPGLADMA